MAARRCCNARRWRRWREVARLSRPDVAARDAGDAADAWQVALRLRWPAAAGGLAVAFIAVIAYLRVAPLGVTAELGSLARTAAFDAGWLPARLVGWFRRLRHGGQAGAAVEQRRVRAVAGGGRLGRRAGGGAFKPRLPSAAQISRNFAGGVLMVGAA